MKKFRLIVLIILVLSFFTACVEESDLVAIDSKDKTKIIVEIPNGSTTAKIGGILADKGLIKSAEVFKYVAKQEKIDDSMKAGKYSLSKSMTPAEIANVIAKGQVYTNTVKVLIPEGYEFMMIVDKLVEALNLDRDKLIDLAENHNFDYKFLAEKPEGVKYRLEGYLFPATYNFKADASELDVLKVMLDKFDSVYNDECYAAQEELGLTTNKVITMASIVEREAAVADERDLIAGVFYNRIKMKMLFQSCATVQYALDKRKQALLNKDLKVDSPYNTYANQGLPPGPIASPGESSIKAALYPAKHDYLFFVLNEVGEKSHHFSKTLKEHERAKSKYKKSVKGKK